MAEIVQLVSIAILTAILTIIVKQYKPELAALVQLGGVILVVLMVVQWIPDIFDTSGAMLQFASIDGKWLQVLVKALGIAIVTELGINICEDNSNKALASVVSLAGKILILLVALPLLRAVAEIAAGLIG